MKQRGFTLIELLAVIVILAIIALIAVPIVLGIINDSKKESLNRSMELYLDHVQKIIAKEQMKDPTFNPSKCKINEGNLTCDGKAIQIEMKGQTPKSGTIKFSKGMVIEGVNLELDGLYYQVKNDNISKGTKEKVTSYSDYITKVSDADNDGKVSPGDKYTYEVMDNMENPYTFYVLSVEGDKVNLIMDRNICTNGDQATEQNTCLIAWYSTDTSEDSNNYNVGLGSMQLELPEELGDNSNGPVTAMEGLYNATKNWTNVPNMNLDYSDEGHIANSDCGYGKIETTETGIKITKKDGTTEVTRNGNQTPVIPYETNKPLKARLPKLEEVYNSDTTDKTHCHSNVGSCPAWLTNGLASYSSYYQDNDHISGIYGYWQLSSGSSHSYIASIVNYSGHVGSNFTFNDGGLRAVITVSKSDLQ